MAILPGSSPTLPTGTTPYGSQLYKATDGSIWMGTSAFGFFEIGKDLDIDSVRATANSALAIGQVAQEDIDALELQLSAANTAISNENERATNRENQIDQKVDASIPVWTPPIYVETEGQTIFQIPGDIGPVFPIKVDRSGFESYTYIDFATPEEQGRVFGYDVDTATVTMPVGLSSQGEYIKFQYRRIGTAPFAQGYVTESAFNPFKDYIDDFLKQFLVQTLDQGIFAVDSNGMINMKVNPDGSFSFIEILSQILNGDKVLTDELTLSDNLKLYQIEGYDFVIHDTEGFIQFAVVDGQILGLVVPDPTTDEEIITEIPSSFEFMEIYGQSLSLAGSQSSSENAIHTSPIDNLFMFQGGVNSIDAVNQSTRANAITPLIEGAHSGTTNTKETNGFSFGATYLEFLASEDDYLISPDNEFNILMSADGQGGQSAEQLKKGTTRYNEFIKSLEAAVLRGNATGRAVKCNVISWVQGEQDITLNTSKEAYKATVNQIYLDMAADVKLRTGQTEDPIFVLAQTASQNFYFYTNGTAYPKIALAQLELCIENPNFELGSCLYHFEYQPNVGGIPNADVHMTRDSYMKMASDLAYTAKRRNINSQNKRFLYPKSVFKQGNIIEITFNKNYGRLVFDTVNVQNPGNFGFNLRSVSGNSGTAIAITSVSIIRDDTVRIVASQPLVSGNSLTYGQNGADQRAGRLSGQRGCLRDSTGDIASRFIYGAENYRLDKWCPIFEYIF